MAAFFFSWLFALLALTYWPDVPSLNSEETGFRIDYLAHFGFYAVLIVLFLLWQHAKTSHVNIQFIILACLGGIALGAITEISQLFIPDRSLNPFDMLFNCLGIVAGAIAFKTMSKKSIHQ